MIEEWKPVENYEDYYQVSNTGKVMSIEKLCKIRGGSFRLRPASLLQITNNSAGYSRVYFVDRRYRLVHRLVAQHFIPNPENKAEVNHIDGNKNNCHVSNLEWSTRSNNMKHAWDNGMGKNRYTK